MTNNFKFTPNNHIGVLKIPYKENLTKNKPFFFFFFELSYEKIEQV